ncbi:hypothetical protein GBAR_LOCUS8502 [Geodia barretti]|uniref:Ig-like domain-containing protein n=1 Tax=Geodia barretti TaxID=519541 RepID=A0AA35RKU5_GEOBA|nr:hypothetical protein GBAR_LOCUS8502 [Geodia barretti]
METNLIISYIALEGNLDLGPEVFLEQPKNATVQELETAVFRCSIINTSFEIYWRLNDSDAGHSKFDDIGYRVVFPNRYDHTVSRMEIAGRLRNNNTIVHCAAVGEEPVLSWTDSERALLIVQAEATSHSTFQHELAHTSQHSLLPTQTVELIEASLPSQSVTSSQNPTPNDDTEQGTAIVLFGTIVSAVFSLLIVVIFTLVILLIFISNKKRKVDCRRDGDDGDIRLGPNPVYECTKPIEIHKNELYELSKLIQCQQNAAFPQSRRFCTPVKMMPLLLLFISVGGFTRTFGDGEKAAGVFVDQPERTTVNQFETATFRCSVVNSSFSIFWLVNNSDAAFTVFRERGFSIKEDPNTHTKSQLKVAGIMNNNNTQVYCAALQEHRDPQLTWIESQTALLVVQGQTMFGNTLSVCIYVTEPTDILGVSTSSLSLEPSAVATALPSQLPLTDESWKEDLRFILIMAGIAVVFILLSCSVLANAIVLFRRHGCKKGTKASVEMTPQNEQLPNVS